jgi:hypothetical protein
VIYFTNKTRENTNMKKVDLLGLKITTNLNYHEMENIPQIEG